MHTYFITKGTTNVSIELEIIDSTAGTPETGVVWNTAGIALEYRRDGAASTAITEATLAALTTAHTDGGFLHIGNGVYRFDLPDAACAAGVDKVVIHGTVTGMIVIPVCIQLTDIDIFDAVRGGMTALPNAAADAAGGLPISDAGGLDLDAMNTNINDIETDTADMQPRVAAIEIDTNELQTDWVNGGRLDLLLDAIPTTPMRGTDNAALAASLPTNFVDLAITATTGLVTVGTNNDKTGYALTQAFPTNFADLAITATTGLISVGTSNDKTGYSLAADQSAVTIGVVSVLTGHTAQTGDTYALAAGATGFAAIDTVVDSILVDTNQLQLAHAGGNLGVDVDKINGITITGDGSITPFNV